MIFQIIYPKIKFIYLHFILVSLSAINANRTFKLELQSTRKEDSHVKKQILIQSFLEF